MTTGLLRRLPRDERSPAAKRGNIARAAHCRGLDDESLYAAPVGKAKKPAGGGGKPAGGAAGKGGAPAPKKDQG